MIFSSPTFLFLFLPVVLLVHGVFLRSSTLPRNIILLAASLIFYSWGEPFYILLMLFSIGANHLLAKGAPLWLGITINLLLLSFFKYGDFFTTNINILLSSLNFPLLPLFKASLPLGISFFTFQSISYLIDVSRKVAPPQKNPLNTALYIALFPQLIAGPIVRYHQIADQINVRSVSLTGFEYGVYRFVYGLGKKVLIANTLAEFVDYAFLLPADNITTPIAWLAVTGYAFQIYFDFSGYSDMAIGLGAMFGFTFPENFRYPYAAKSIREFWRRWHITLSEWFRDYLFIPLGGSRGSNLRTYVNLIVVFFLCGLWHGAAWTFVIWGLFHGIFLSLERGLFGKLLKQTPLFLQHLYTLLVVLFGWVLFRATSFEQALLFWKKMLGIGSGTPDPYIALRLSNEFFLVFSLAALFSLPAINQASKKLSREKLTVGFAYSCSIVLILILSASKLASGTYNPFIYFRF